VTVGAYPGLVPFDLQAVMFRELTVLGTRVYRAEDVAAALQLLDDERIDPGLVVTSVLPLTEGAEAIDRLRSGREAKVLLRTGRP
jgi:threonine dehydrogenase-like Zn-dependent dehydrogenase